MASLTKSNQRDVAAARNIRDMMPDAMSDGIYARSLSGIHRASSLGQQRAIELVIADDDTGHLFTRHQSGALIEAGAA